MKAAVMKIFIPRFDSLNNHYHEKCTSETRTLKSHITRAHNIQRERMREPKREGKIH